LVNAAAAIGAGESPLIDRPGPYVDGQIAAIAHVRELILEVRLVFSVRPTFGNNLQPAQYRLNPSGGKSAACGGTDISAGKLPGSLLS
jgi:hypothetical protein